MKILNSQISSGDKSGRQRTYQRIVENSRGETDEHNRELAMAVIVECDKKRFWYFL